MAVTPCQVIALAAFITLCACGGFLLLYIDTLPKAPRRFRRRLSRRG